MPFGESTLPWSVQSLLLTILLISLFFPFYITLTVFAVIFIILAFSNTLTATFLPRNSLQTVLWLALFYSFVIAVVSINFLGTIAAIGLFFTMIVFSYYVKNVRPEFLDDIINISLVASFIVFIFAIMEHFNIIAEWDYTFISKMMAEEHPERVEATFFNPNYYAMMLEFFITFSLYKFCQTKQWSTRITCVFLALCNFVALIYTGSRTSFLVILTVLFVFFYIIGYKKQAAGSVITVVGLILIAMVTGHFPRLDSIPWGLEDRIEIWENAMRGIRDHFWFGQGFMSYGHLSSFYGYPFKTHAHNLLLDVLLNFGVIGCSLLILPLYRIGQLMNNMRQYPEIRLKLALYCSLITCILVHGLTDVPIMWVQTAGLFLFVFLTAPNTLKKAEIESATASAMLLSLDYLDHKEEK
ncbi:MAG: O-antigen ligase family protein [Aerococcus sp.]|nr:O-antigen ligase family protein [Aerococcus sp.]